MWSVMPFQRNRGASSDQAPSEMQKADESIVMGPSVVWQRSDRLTSLPQ